MACLAEIMRSASASVHLLLIHAAQHSATLSTLRGRHREKASQRLPTWAGKLDGDTHINVCLPRKYSLYPGVANLHNSAERNRCVYPNTKAPVCRPLYAPNAYRTITPA